MLPRTIIIRSMPRHRGGFTLIEVMMVVVILGILAAIVAPQISAAGDVAGPAAARLMIGDLLYAQSQAISTQKQWCVTFATAGASGNGGYSITASNPNASETPRVVTFGSGSASQLTNVRLESANLGGAGNTVLVFGSLGEPYGCAPGGTPVELTGAGTVVVQCGSQSLSLSIEPDTGNITLPQ